MARHDPIGPTREIRTHRPQGNSRGLRARASLLPFVAAVLLVVTGGVVANAVINDPSAGPRPNPLPAGSRGPAGLTSQSPSADVVAVAEPSTQPPSPAATIAGAAPPTSTLASPRLTRTSTKPPVAATSLAPQPFVPLTVQAEGPGSTLTAGATVMACAPCGGGFRVGYIAGENTVVVRATLASAGARTIQVTYESDGLRQLKVKVNGVVVDERWLDGTGWDVPRVYQFAMSLPAGAVQLTFYNDASPAPDVDQVVIR